MSTQVLISFDTTGSMSPCIVSVRREVTQMVERLFSTIPDLEMGIISHGDYCDGSRMYQDIGFTDSKRLLIEFVNDAPNTSGGDSDELYEYVLHKARTHFDWTADNKIFMLIADAKPHAVGYTYRHVVNQLDWRIEAQRLADLGVSIYAIEALGNHNSRTFYEPLANMTNGRKLDLNQFSDAVETIVAVCYHKTDKLEEYKVELETSFKMNRNLAEVFKKLGSKSVSSTFIRKDDSGLVAVPPYRFQMLDVDYTTDIKSFVLSTGATFKKGRGFYQFTKSETIQEMKEVILRNKLTGDMFTGAEAREFIGLPFGIRGRIRPKFFDEYEVYIQSTSANRKLVGGTKFLYENDHF